MSRLYIFLHILKDWLTDAEISSLSMKFNLNQLTKI